MFSWHQTHTTSESAIWFATLGRAAGPKAIENAFIIIDHHAHHMLAQHLTLGLLSV